MTNNAADEITAQRPEKQNESTLNHRPPCVCLSDSVVWGSVKGKKFSLVFIRLSASSGASFMFRLFQT